MSQNDFAFTRDSLYGTQAEPTFAGATSFMRRRFSRDLDGVDLAITGVPFDSAASHRPGTRFGPRGLRIASKRKASVILSILRNLLRKATRLRGLPTSPA